MEIVVSIIVVIGAFLALADKRLIQVCLALSWVALALAGAASVLRHTLF